MRRLSLPALSSPLVFLVGCLLLVPTIAFLPTRHWYLAPMPALGGLFLFALWHRPLWGLLLVLFLVPSDQFRSISAQYQWLTVSKLVGVALILITVAHWIVLSRPMPIRSRLWPFLALFLIAGGLTTTYASNMPTAIDEMRKMVVAVLFFGLTLSIVPYKSLFRHASWTVIGGVALGALLSLYGALTGDPVFSITVGRGMTRAVGGSNDPNLFSVSLLFALPLLAHYAFEAEHVRTRILAILLAAVNVAALVATYSRGGGINLLIMVCLLLFEHRRRLTPRKVGLALGAASLVFLVAVAVIPSSYWQRQRSVTSSTDTSITRRWNYLVLGWHTFKERPLMGHGPGTFKKLWAEAIYTGRIGQDIRRGHVRPAHNTYLEILIGKGLVGLLLFLTVIFIALRDFGRSRTWLEKAGRMQEASLVGAWRLAFISILFYYLILSSQTHKFFWFSLACSQILALQYASDEKEQA